MPLNKQQFSRYIKDFNFRELFNDMGWNNDKTTQPIIVDDETFTLRSIAVKSGFKILICDPDRNGVIPDYNTRKKIETKVTKLFQEHLIIFSDAKKQEQVWQLVVRQTGKPTKVTETRYSVAQDPELLFQRASGLIFELDEEEHITIVDVTQRVADNFHQNAEKITKQFYDRFKKEHVSFYAFIKGIDDHIDEWNKKRKKSEPEQENRAKQWYVSLMLNRLMFCYFIQKKGFLDKNKNYLRDKLKECKQKKGKDKFYSFYRNFLLVLFHEGLNEPDQKEKIKIEIGKIPYLNGGLFDEHELETSYKIDIDDKAFERIFDFFDEYEWHLDTRVHASGKDINPDVIGYIFEKYINDRAQMGAYYTKEDITDYISKNCIIPWLFDETARQYPKAFASDGVIWQQLKESNDTYIYPAIKYGMSEALPKEIAGGFKEVAKRGDWNKPAASQFALPTEIWRETVERRKRYEEILEKIGAGDITHINEFITYNLNIRQFAQDIVQNTDDPELLRAFYKALNKVTIIDPTCGSGAFLFAAMNILEPLYEACIQRMEIFVQEAGKGKYKYFEEILEFVNAPEHTNRAYFIYKSIILCNLYGVDIMKEAVEIAKLRLFLKLVAAVEADYRKPNLGLEPLPDIDFNIRAGNTLIGFATESELNKGLRYTLDGVAVAPVIEEKCDIVARAFARYKEIQLSYGDDFKEFKKAKENLNERLKELNNELNKLLHKQSEGIKYDQWLETHQPFHWFAEFYEIIHHKKGFDIVIGNPPYIELKDVKSYTLKDYKTLTCGNLYALCYERVLSLSNSLAKIGFIIPVASVCTDGYSDLQKIWLQNGDLFISSYNDRPGKLFEGLEHIRLAIVLFQKHSKKDEYKVNSTKYYRWHTVLRPYLFETIYYADVSSLVDNTQIPKLNSPESVFILERMQENHKRASYFLIKNSNHVVYFTRKMSGFVQILDFVPKIYDNKGKLRPPSELKKMHFGSEDQAKTFLSFYNSSLFYWYLTVWSDCRNLNFREIQNVKFDFTNAKKQVITRISSLSEELMEDIVANSTMQKMSFKSVGELKIQCIFPKYSKAIIDRIDETIGKHYDLGEEEIDFIKNYDVKFRLGRSADEEDD